MREFTQIQMELCASLWMAPGSIEELQKRDFLAGICEYNLVLMIRIMKSKKWVYERQNRLFCYKNTVETILNPAGFELE